MPKVGGAGRLTPATISYVPPRSPRKYPIRGLFFPTLPPLPPRGTGPPVSSELTRLTHALLQSKTKMPEVDKDFDAPYYEPTVCTACRRHPSRRGCIQLWSGCGLTVYSAHNLRTPSCFADGAERSRQGLRHFKATSTTWKQRHRGVRAGFHDDIHARDADEGCCDGFPCQQGIVPEGRLERWISSWW